MPVRQAPAQRRRGIDRHEPLAPQRPLHQLDDLGRQMRQVAQRLMADLAALAERPSQQHRLVLPDLPRLVHVPAAHPGHMHRTRTPRHNADYIGQPPTDRPRHTTFYWLRHQHLTEHNTQVNSTSSVGTGATSG
jgi:hypothetical protein